MKKKWVKGLLYALSFFLVMLGVGSVYQAIGVRADRDEYQPIGSLYEVKGTDMHLFAAGEGEATVVFATGWGTVQPYVDYYPLTQRVSQHAKVAVYDRPGSGFSEQTDRVRDIDKMVDEIHELLAIGGQRPPYVLVGHSLGSLEVLRFAQRYPDEVKGIVIIDGGTPEYYAKTKPLTAISHVQRFLVNTGVVRTLLHFDGVYKSLNNERNELRDVPEELRQLDLQATRMIASNPTVTDEMRNSQANAKKVLSDKAQLPIPLRSFVAGSSADGWIDDQKEWLTWSADAEQQIVEGAKHYVHHYEPELVADVIIELIEQ